MSVKSMYLEAAFKTQEWKLNKNEQKCRNISQSSSLVIRIDKFLVEWTVLKSFREKKGHQLELRQGSCPLDILELCFVYVHIHSSPPPYLPIPSSHIEQVVFFYNLTYLHSFCSPSLDSPPPGSSPALPVPLLYHPGLILKVMSVVASSLR